MTDRELTPSLEIERSVVNKVMARLAPFLALLYVFNLLDRGNVSIAALTMQKDLRFSDTVYGLGAGMFFVGYFFFEIPSNLIMERVGARRWIARIMLTWGIVSTSMLWVRSPFSFYSLRFLLGLAEAGFYPGILLYLTYWVPASAHARVIARFLAMTAILGLFGGPLGGLLLKLNGVGGLKGWQWLFLLEGLPSILLSFVVFVVLPDKPARAGWLTQEEKDWLAKRLQQETRNEKRVQHMSWRVAITEPRILHLCLIFFITATAGNAIGFFGPQLLKSRSHGEWSDSFVATVGIIPAIVGAIAMSITAVRSDRSGRRREYVMLGYMVAGLAYLLCVYAPSGWWVVAAFALNALGERCAAGSYWALTTNLMGARAAAGGIAFINSVGNLGGFFGTTLMGELKNRTQGGYTAGLYTAAGMFLFAALLSSLLRHHPSSLPEPEAEILDETAAVAQPEQHIP